MSAPAINFLAAARTLSRTVAATVEMLIAEHLLWSPRLELRGWKRTDVVLNDGRRWSVTVEQRETAGATAFAVVTRLREAPR